MEGHNALAVGSEMSGGVRYIFMENNSMGKVSSAIYFKSNLDRGGFIENVRVRNIEVQKADILLRFSTNYHSYKGGVYPALYRDFIIENVTAEKVNIAVKVTGISELPIQDVLVKNVTVDQADVVQQIKYVQNLIYDNVEINGKIVEVDLIEK